MQRFFFAKGSYNTISTIRLVRTVLGVVLIMLLLQSASPTANAQSTEPHWYPMQKLSPIRLGNDQSFGYDLAATGKWMLVSTHNKQSNSHRVDVCRFDHTTGSWKHSETLLPKDHSGDQGFGSAVDIDGDFAIVGANRDGGNGRLSGAAYIYRFDHQARTWMQEAKLAGYPGIPNERFGTAVALAYPFAVIGAPTNGQGLARAGMAYLFKHDANMQSWVQMQQLVPMMREAFDYFGAAVSIHADRIVIGGMQAGPGANGAAHIFRFDSRQSQWVEERRLLASDRMGRSGFGSSVGIENDVVVIGDPNQGEPGAQAGQAYVFRYENNMNNWAEEARLTGAADHDHAMFAHDVCMRSGRVAIGAKGENTMNGDQAGRVYLFEYDDNMSHWIEAERFVSPSPQASQMFGSSVAIVGDRSLLCGAIGDDNTKGQSAGAVFDFHSFEMELPFPTPGLAGMVNRFVVQRATPGSKVLFLRAMQRGTVAVPSCPGLTVDLRLPIHVFGRDIAGKSGRAWTDVFVSLDALEVMFDFQAIEIGDHGCAKSNPICFMFE